MVMLQFCYELVAQPTTMVQEKDDDDDFVIVDAEKLYTSTQNMV